MFAGLVGLAGIWLVLPVAAFLGMRGYRGATRPVESAAAHGAICVLPAYAVQCYGDIGFQSFTCALILGVALAAAAKVSAWAENRGNPCVASPAPCVGSPVTGRRPRRPSARLRHLVAAMTDAQRHRGPDGEGLWRRDRRSCSATAAWPSWISARRARSRWSIRPADAR